MLFRFSVAVYKRRLTPVVQTSSGGVYVMKNPPLLEMEGIIALARQHREENNMGRFNLEKLYKKVDNPVIERAK